MRSFFSICSAEVAMNVWMRNDRQASGIGGALDVCVVGAGEEQIVLSLINPAMALNGVEIAVGTRCEACFDHIDLHPFDAFAIRIFSSFVIDAAGGMLAIAQGRVENDQFVCMSGSSGGF